MKWKVEEVPHLRGYTVEWAEPGNYFLSRRNVIFHSDDLDPPFEQITTIGAPAWKSAAANIRMFQRLLRFMVTNVVPLVNGDIFVAFDKSVGLIRSGTYFRLGGMVRPFRILRSACAVDKDGTVYFGEYLSNDDRGPMHIYSYTPGEDSIKSAHTFQAGEIRHIHGIYRDPFDDLLYCLTGDRPEECRIISTTDGFRTIELLGRGDETWRAVSLVFTPEAILYGTDAAFRTNEIYRIDRKTKERISLGEVNSTVFYSRYVAESAFFATTAENAPAQKENAAAIWCTTTGGKLTEVIKFAKDRWQGTLFQFGTISFPNGPIQSNELYFSVVAVKGDNRTFRIFPGV